MFLHPWDFPGKNTRVGCHFLLQRIFPTQGSNPGHPHCRQTLYHLSDQGGHPGEGHGNPLQFSCLGNQRSLAGYGPRGCRELDTIELAPWIMISLFYSFPHTLYVTLMSYFSTYTFPYFSCFNHVNISLSPLFNSCIKTFRYIS